nr:hypothetical protein [Pedobacter sp. ASV19]
MKKLLNKTLRTFALYSLLVLAASVPAYYYLVDRIWLSELDEHNEIIAERTEKELNKLQLTEAELTQSIALWNKIQPGTDLKKATTKIRKNKRVINAMAATVSSVSSTFVSTVK